MVANRPRRANLHFTRCGCQPHKLLPRPNCWVFYWALCGTRWHDANRSIAAIFADQSKLHILVSDELCWRFPDGSANTHDTRPDYSCPNVATNADSGTLDVSIDARSICPHFPHANGYDKLYQSQYVHLHPHHTHPDPFPRFLPDQPGTDLALSTSMSLQLHNLPHC